MEFLRLIDQTIALGPLALPVSVLLLFGATAIGWWVGARLAARKQVGFDLPAGIVLGCAIVVARLAFVLEYRELYLQTPLAMLNIRGGGWNAIGAIAAGGVSAVLLSTWRAQYGKPLAAALATGGAAWLVGALGFALLQEPHRMLPPLVLADLAGRPVAVGQFTGKPLILNLWVTWCPPAGAKCRSCSRGRSGGPT